MNLAAAKKLWASAGEEKKLQVAQCGICVKPSAVWFQQEHLISSIQQVMSWQNSPG